MSFKLRGALLLAIVILVMSCGGGDATPGGGSGDGKSLRIAYVTNGVDPFWDVAVAGARAGAKEFDAKVEVHMPQKGIVDQKRMIEGLLARGIDGIAISPVDTKNQTGQINEAASVTNVITHDSDAPDSNRLCFVGMDNYSAGRAVGKLVKEALPDGGSVMLFVGRLEQLNALERRQGIYDELLGHPEQERGAMKFDDPGATYTGDEYTYEILGTRTDNYDRGRAKSNAEDAIAAHPDLGCMVGLFGYNPPACLAAIQEAGKGGAIQMVGFDEAEATLRGVESGDAYATVTQQPYLYGYHSVRILAALARGDRSVLPEGGFLEIETRTVKKDNLAEFETELAELKKAGQSPEGE